MEYEDEMKARTNEARATIGREKRRAIDEGDPGAAAKLVDAFEELGGDPEAARELVALLCSPVTASTTAIREAATRLAGGSLEDVDEDGRFRTELVARARATEELELLAENTRTRLRATLATEGKKALSREVAALRRLAEGNRHYARLVEETVAPVLAEAKRRGRKGA